jgi:hypothetical protein
MVGEGFSGFPRGGFTGAYQDANTKLIHLGAHYKDSVMQLLSIARLVSLLESSDHPPAAAVLAVASSLADRSIPLARQEARRWRATLSLKYSMVRDRGFRVEGLESLLESLAKVDERCVLGGSITSEEKSCLIVLDEAGDAIVGMLYIVSELTTRASDLRRPR